jgi:hypothetical protein
LVVVIFVSVAAAQNATENWLRVMTGEDSTVEVDHDSLALRPNQMISARFKTKFATPQSVPGKAGAVYNDRIDSIIFDTAGRRYRIAESSFFDSAGTKVYSHSASPASDWKPSDGLTVNRLFNAAVQLPPYGAWTVISYRYASGEPASAADPTELKKLVGSETYLKWNKIVVGGLTCLSPALEPKTVTNEEFLKVAGSSLDALGLGPTKVEAVYIDCKGQSDFASRILILKLSGAKALMLWEGVFLEMERSAGQFLP